MAISIRVARASDAHEIAELTTQLGYQVDVHTVAARLSRIVSRNDQQFLVAELDGHPIGWVHALIAEFVDTGSFAVVGGLVVDRSHRGKGIGRLLMAQAEEWAMTRGCSMVRLWSSAVRTDSHRFYAALGYTNIKTQYSFAKPVGTPGNETLQSLVPDLDR
jgi:GNAT superfamily N-acetyltransferase